MDIDSGRLCLYCHIDEVTAHESINSLIARINVIVCETVSSPGAECKYKRKKVHCKRAVSDLNVLQKKVTLSENGRIKVRHIISVRAR